MKTKSKIILYTLLGACGIVGLSSSVKANRQMTIYLRLGANEYEQLNPSDQGASWDCVPSFETCHYEKIDSTGETVDANMTRGATGTFVAID